uniref:Uncharacterized protein n=1 Tax=Solanum lycopersicum TaxID=4081 RepID=A0A494G995_SOLLC
MAATATGSSVVCTQFPPRILFPSVTSDHCDRCVSRSRARVQPQGKRETRWSVSKSCYFVPYKRQQSSPALFPLLSIGLGCDYRGGHGIGSASARSTGPSALAAYRLCSQRSGLVHLYRSASPFRASVYGNARDGPYTNQSKPLIATVDVVESDLSTIEIQLTCGEISNDGTGSNGSVRGNYVSTLISPVRSQAYCARLCRYVLPTGRPSPRMYFVSHLQPSPTVRPRVHPKLEAHYAPIQPSPSQLKHGGMVIDDDHGLLGAHGRSDNLLDIPHRTSTSLTLPSQRMTTVSRISTSLTLLQLRTLAIVLHV